MQAWKLDDKEVANAAGWAAKAGDEVLASQLTVLYNISGLVRNIAIVEKAARAGRGKKSSNKVSDDLVKMLRDLRSYTAASAEIFQHEKNKNAFKPCADLAHLKILDEKVPNLIELQESLTIYSRLLQREFYEHWEVHGAELVKMLESYQPSWQLRKVSVFTEGWSGWASHL